MKEFDMKMLQKVNIIIPNEVEASQITGIQVKDRESAKKASDKLKEYVDTVIITLGDNGVYCEKVNEEILPRLQCQND